MPLTTCKDPVADNADGCPTAMSRSQPLRPAARRLCVARWLAASLLIAALAGCTRTPQATVPLPALDAQRGRMAWEGELPCADCDGIQTRLQLRRNGERRVYQLIEVFVLGDRGARFVDSGSWSREGDLIRMLGDDGSARVYGLLADGGLQPRDAGGGPFALHADAVLMPTGTSVSP